MSSKTHHFALQIAGAFASVAIFISFRQIFAHITNYTNPSIQKNVIRVLTMVPVYSLGSWLSLQFSEYSLYIDLIRDCYEAFVIYAFVNMLIEYSEGETELLKKLEKHGPMHHMFPFNFLPNFKTDKNFLLWCKRVVLQYVFIKPSSAFLSILLDEMNLYDEGHFKLNRGYIYILVINNISVTAALYGLLYFYHAIEHELARIQPFKKLLCIKAVLFLAFWQGIAIAGFASLGWIHETAYHSLEQVEVELQDFLICVEMIFAAVAHDLYYNYREFSSKKSEWKKWEVVADVFTMKDIIADARVTFFSQKQKPE